MKKWIHAATASERAQQAAQRKYEAELKSQYVKDCAKAIQQIVKKSDTGMEVEWEGPNETKVAKVKPRSSVFKYAKNEFVVVVDVDTWISDEMMDQYRSWLNQIDSRIADLVAAEYPDLEAIWGKYPGRYSRGYDLGYRVKYIDE